MRKVPWQGADCRRLKRPYADFALFMASSTSLANRFRCWLSRSNISRLMGSVARSRIARPRRNRLCGALECLVAGLLFAGRLSADALTAGARFIDAAAVQARP